MTARFLEWLLLILSLNACTGLYEDQIGKFEWRQQYVGKLKFSHLDIFSPIKKVIIASEQNVISALSLKSGEILWRQILEQDESNSIQFMSVDNDITTISGNNFPLVRGWDLENGHLMWEWGISRENEHTKWFSINQKLYQIDFYKHSEIELTVYQSSSGKKLRFEKIPAAWLEPEKCVLQNDILACVTSDKLIYSVKFVNSAGEIDIKVQHKSLLDLFKEEVSGVLKTTEGPLSIVTVNAGGNNKAISLHPEITVLKTTEMKNQLLATANVEQQKLIAAVSLQNEVLDVKTVDIDGETLPELSNQLNYPDINGKPEFVLFVCQPRRDRGIACRILISTSHHVLLLLQHPGKILWTREESLASVVTAEMIDLPVSDTDAAIEKEFDSKDCGFIGMFFRRIISQSVQLQNLFLTVMGLRRTTSTDDKESLIRDEFGLHKLIVAATSPGKIYGIDNLTGKIVWQIKIDDIEPYHSIKPTLPFFELRTARHAPYPAKCAILAKHKITQEGVLIIFNPITGQLEDNTKKLIKLGFKVKQSLLLHEVDEEFSKGILFLDDENNVHVYPDSSKSIAISLAPSTFIFTADASTGILEGYSLALSTKDKLISTRMWQIRLGQGSDKIISVLAKNNLERVHSQGRVLGDRSVLYKYVNPNLVSVITQGYHPSHKTILNLHLVDVVSGNIVFSATHRRAKEPVHVVHSENWLVYTYFNEKYRRTELASLEMYEGKTQSNATAFSSVDSASLLPIVERQAYIFPANVLALKETITEKGITSKHILVGLANGGILELPWVYADPRRPITVTPEMREEGVIPYMPELPIPLEAIINHNQTVANVRGIHTSSSGLESTCLVFAYGLDIFYTRVAPSKTFDLLKDDFDYYLITTVLLALAAASYITKKLSSRKALKQAWK